MPRARLKFQSNDVWVSLLSSVYPHNTYYPQPATSIEQPKVRRRTPSVRRQSAAKSGHSPESPPSATCCLSRTKPHQSHGVATANLQTGWTTKVVAKPLSPFVTAKFGTSLSNADGMRLPCHTRIDRLGRARFVTSPSTDSPHMLPHVSYLDHTPSLRHTRCWPSCQTDAQ